MQLIAGRGFIAVSRHGNFNIYFYNPCNVVIEGCNSKGLDINFKTCSGLWYWWESQKRDRTGWYGFN
jgi:hypothetical protein